ENEANRGAGFEALVREEPVEADGYAERRNHVHTDHETEIDPAEPPAPQRGDGDTEAREWKHDRDNGSDPGQERERLGQIRVFGGENPSVAVRFPRMNAPSR